MLPFRPVPDNHITHNSVKCDTVLTDINKVLTTGLFYLLFISVTVA